MTAADVLAQYLSALMTTDDPIFRSVVADPNGTPAFTILKPMDYDKGAMANILEWLRNMSGGDGSLIDQLRIDLADTKWLNYKVLGFYGLPRFPSETDAELIARVQKYVLSPKISPASIIFACIPFSSTTPIILEGQRDTAFADVSFSDQYRLFQVVGGPEAGNYVQPALAGPSDGGGPFFTLILTDTLASDYARVVDIVERWRAAGVAYEIQVQS